MSLDAKPLTIIPWVEVCRVVQDDSFAFFSFGSIGGGMRCLKSNSASLMHLIPHRPKLKIPKRFSIRGGD